MNLNNDFRTGKEYSNAEYDKFKAECETHQPVIKHINIGSFNLINGKTVEITQVIDGARITAPFEMTDNAFKQLMKVLGLTYGVFQIFIDTFGNDITSYIFEEVRKKLKEQNTNTTISILVSPQTNKIINIIKYRGTTVNNNMFFSIVDTALNGFQNNGMKIKNLNVTEDGNIAITVVNDNWTFDLEGLQTGLKDEYFTSGMTLIKTADKVIINPFNERLVCINGMVSPIKGHSLVLSSTNAENVKIFFEQVKDYGNNRKGFENDFKQQIIKMLSTNASFLELSNAYHTVSAYTDLSNERSRMQLHADFHLHDIQSEFQKRFNVNLFEQNNRFTSKIITDYNVWDLVNKLTWIASNPHSHEYDFKSLNNTVFGLQRTAGELTFKEHYDLGESVPQLFKNDAVITNAAIIEKLKNQSI